MSKTLDYFLVPQPPWAYLGHARLAEIAARRGAAVVVRPMDLGRIFPLSGGLPLGKRAPQRQSYRLVELARWSTFLGMPLNVHPKFFPVAGDDAARWIVAARAAGGDAAAMRMAGGLLAAVWAQERDIADPATLAAIAREQGLDAAALAAGALAPAAQEEYDRNTQAATDAQVFGAPWYVYRGEPFWGQDRLEFLDRALGAN